MISCEFNFCCDGEKCTKHFSDGFNRLLEQQHDAWIAARKAGWREIIVRGKVKQLCPSCFKSWLERKK